jgi:hypothetical protein
MSTKRYEPLNLKALFGGRFKIRLDESAFCAAESKNDSWYYQIPCKYGHIYAYSDRLLAYYCDSGRVRRERLHRQHPEIEVCQWGDYEAVFLLPPDQLELIAKYARPRRKRKLSPEHRQKLANFSLGRRDKSGKYRSGVRKTAPFRAEPARGVLDHSTPSKTRFSALKVNSKKRLKEP